MMNEQEAQQAQTIAKRPKMRSEESETPKSRAVFYSILWPSMRKAAMDLGWALALHGSLQVNILTPFLKTWSRKQTPRCPRGKINSRSGANERYK